MNSLPSLVAVLPALEPTLGPFHLFGLLVATGVLVGRQFIVWRGKRLGLPPERMRWVVVTALVSGFLGSHLVEMVFYWPGEIAEHGPLVLFSFWDGMSSYGGVAGAIAGHLMLFGFRHRPRFVLVLAVVLPFAVSALSPYSVQGARIGLVLVWAGTVAVYLRPDEDRARATDLAVEGFVLGWVFGRAGCTFAFDHPGAISDFALAMPYGPTGVSRHNLGFYEVLHTVFVLVPVLVWLARRPRPPGTVTAVAALLYASARFGLEFLRSTDLSVSCTRFFGLTPAHYFSAVLFVFALGWLVRLRRRRIG